MDTKLKYLLFFMVLFVSFSFTCVKKQSQDIIVARVGDRVITDKEFKQRIELTVRPDFPSQDLQTLKMTLLNNLINEKLFAIEAGNDYPLLKNENFVARIRGIREQKMREQLYYTQAFDKVKIDSTELKERYILSGRDYRLQFYTIHSDDLAKKLQAEFAAKPDSIPIFFDAIAQGGPIPEHEVKWKDPDPIPLHEALFSKPLNVNTIIGPLQIEDDNWVLMKVMDYRTTPPIGMDGELHWREVEDKTRLNKAQAVWVQYMANVMTGKKIEFNKNTFDQLAEMFRNILASKDPEEKKEIAKEFLTVEDKDFNLDAVADKENLLNKPFFTVDGKTWTVRDFRNELSSHPLVYRKLDIGRREFRKQFRYAVADLVRDHFLTKDAYKKSLDQDPKVIKAEVLWRDSFIAMDWRDKILKEGGKTVPQDSIGRTLAMNKYFDDYLSSLQDKYSNKIIINKAELDKIPVTRVNMFAVQENVPYPIAVPSFPIMTSDPKIEYGKILKDGEKIK